MDSTMSAELRARFDAAGQGHVFKFVDQGLLTPPQEESFLKQLDGLDLTYISQSYAAAMADAASGAATADISPPDAFTSLTDCTPEAVIDWENVTLDAIGRGEVAACVLAGGQGTRLGLNGPKGCYNIGLPSAKPLFQLMCERIQRLLHLAKNKGFVDARMPLLVMTSPINDSETRSFFADNNNFGLSKDAVWFFAQGTLPCLTPDGKIILESSNVVATAPDGNGGFYPALQNSGTLARMRKEGCKYLHVFSVDNSLCRPADPTFVGLCITRGADVGNKCVWKAHPEEKVGVVAKKGGRPSVIEYSELDDENKNLRDANGKLLFGAGNICNHFYTLDFIEQKIIPNCAGLFHLAHKKIPFAGEDGVTQKPDKNNGIKLESFIFDVFSMSQNMVVLEASRAEEFAPVKNAPGEPTDSPDSARAMYSELCKRWIVAAGGKIEGPSDALLEISPLLSYRGEGLEKISGQNIVLPTYLH